MPLKKVIDMHVHIGGPGDSGSGCRMSPEFIFRPSFAAMFFTLKINPLVDFKDGRIKEIMVDIINGSEKVDYTVLLALDGVYRNGKYIEAESHLVVPNTYIIDIAGTNSRVLFGASVHPYRKRSDMVYEAERCIDNGAVLFKWIPSSQRIDPKDKRCIPFYEILVKKDIPLLCHTGAELAVPTSNPDANRFNNPKRLKVALDIGVKVIAAHCATPYIGGFLPDDVDYFGVLIEMLRASEKKKWNLYADISAFCTPTRITYLKRINQEVSKGRISPERFIYGSDFPIPVIDINIFKDPPDLNELIENTTGDENPLDRNYEILKEFGIHDSIFTNACDVLRWSNK